jgi:site-specific recombinase XerD
MYPFILSEVYHAVQGATKALQPPRTSARKRVTPHTLRQVFASELLRTGAALRL